MQAAFLERKYHAHTFYLSDWYQHLGVNKRPEGTSVGGYLGTGFNPWTPFRATLRAQAPTRVPLECATGSLMSCLCLRLLVPFHSASLSRNPLVRRTAPQSEVKHLVQHLKEVGKSPETNLPLITGRVSQMGIPCVVSGTSGSTEPAKPHTPRYF